MINSNPNVKNTLSKVKKTMACVKNSAKDSAILRNQTTLHAQFPISHRRTRECNTIVKFDRTHDDLVAVRRSEDANFEMDESASFKRKVSKLCDVLSTTKSLPRNFKTKTTNCTIAGQT